MHKQILISALYIVLTNTCISQEIIPLWSDTDFEKNVSNEQQQPTKPWLTKIIMPTLEIYLPSKRIATKTGVVVCPGGSYRGLNYQTGGTDVAKWLNSKGIAAFVLKYRLPKSDSVILGNNVSLQDAQRAVQLVRHNSKKWNTATHKIGIMGFSAGGHLASTTGTHPYQRQNLSNNKLDSISAMPNFMALIYPVITMKAPYAHSTSKQNLIGENPPQKLIDLYSNELHVNTQTPPTFIAHATNDTLVDVMNSVLFYKALQKEGIYSEMHLYAKGKHGFGLGLAKNKTYAQSWVDDFIKWVSSLE